MTKGFRLEPCTLPLDDSWDVIVVGGGPAGCTAVAAAAWGGRETLLIEATGASSGTISSRWMTACDSIPCTNV